MQKQSFGLLRLPLGPDEELGTFEHSALKADFRPARRGHYFPAFG